MLKIKVKDARCDFEQDGTILELATECAIAVRGMYDVISKYSPVLGQWFKEMAQKEQLYTAEHGPDSMLEVEVVEEDADEGD